MTRIRPAQPHDLPALTSLITACIQAMRLNGIEQWDELYPTPAILSDDISRNTLFVAEERGLILGCVAINDVQDPTYADVPWRFRADSVGVIHRLMIEPSEQGRGLARELMAFAEKTARDDRGFRSLRLDAYTRNPAALALYDRLGFRRAGVVQLRKGPFIVFEKSLRRVELSALQTGELPEFRSLLGSPDFGGCFCAVWTSHDETWTARCQDPSQPNFTITERNVLGGRHAGFLVREQGKLVGWTGSGPKSSFPFLAQKLGSRLSPSTDGTWSIGCIAIKAVERGTGLSDPIILAIIEKARQAGAQALEAYPTLPWDEPRQFRGSHRLYQRLGFQEAARERDGNTEILLMRHSL